MPTPPLLADRSILLTGASRGMGKALALHLASAGASLVLLARDAAELESTRREVQAIAKPGQEVTTLAGDVTDPRRCAEAADLLAALPGQVPVLINNAAVLGPVGPLEGNDLEAWSQALQVNLLAPAMFSRAVIGLMRSRGGGKIINLSGGGATGPRANFSAYAAAKAGVVRLTETLAVELHDAHIDVNAVAPGAMNTRMTEQLMQAGPTLAGEEYARSQKQLAEGGAPPEKAAELVAFLASSSSNGITGRLLSAMWDDWARLALPERRQKLAQSDVYTLRRIVPKERGLDWDA